MFILKCVINPLLYSVIAWCLVSLSSTETTNWCPPDQILRKCAGVEGLFWMGMFCCAGWSTVQERLRDLWCQKNS